MARYYVNDRFFNERLFYEGEVYDLEPSEVKRITASRQMHHLRALQPELAEPAAPAADPIDDLAKRLVGLNPEQREALSEKIHSIEKPTVPDASKEAALSEGAPEQLQKPMSRAELEELAKSKGIKTLGLSKAQISEKLAQAAPNG
jgi:hypothetical protein